jgi:flagellar export protein FliJ
MQADQAITRAKRGLEKALRFYIQARRQLRMMEVLREKEYAEYRQHLLKLEKKEMDDLSIMRARLHREELT